MKNGPGPLTNNYSLKFTCFITSAAFGAFILINQMGFLPITGNGLDRTPEGAEPATVAVVRINLVVKKWFADTGSAFLITDMFFIFGPEIVQRRLYRIRSRLTQAAKRSFMNGLTYSLENLQIDGSALTSANISQYVQHLYRSKPAGHAFAA